MSQMKKKNVRAWRRHNRLCGPGGRSAAYRGGAEGFDTGCKLAEQLRFGNALSLSPGAAGLMKPSQGAQPGFRYRADLA